MRRQALASPVGTRTRARRCGRPPVSACAGAWYCDGSRRPTRRGLSVPAQGLGTCDGSRPQLRTPLSVPAQGLGTCRARGAWPGAQQLSVPAQGLGTCDDRARRARCRPVASVSACAGAWYLRRATSLARPATGILSVPAQGLGTCDVARGCPATQSVSACAGAWYLRLPNLGQGRDCHHCQCLRRGLVPASAAPRGRAAVSGED